MNSDFHSSAKQVLVHRVCWTVLALGVIATLMVLMAAYVHPFGFFWFSFIAGVFGATVSFLRKLTRDELVDEKVADTWLLTLMPLLYGGMLASVAYFLFMSGILSGEGANGIFSSTLFPNFTGAKPGENGLEVNHFLQSRPRELADGGKLIVWCFLAGYSESFVTGMLGRLENQTAEGQIGDEPDSDNGSRRSESQARS